MFCRLYRIQFFTMVAYFTNAHSMQLFEGFPKLNVYIYQILFIFKSISVKVCANHFADMQMCIIKHPTIVFFKNITKVYCSNSFLHISVSTTGGEPRWVQPVGGRWQPDNVLECLFFCSFSYRHNEIVFWVHRQNSLKNPSFKGMGVHYGQLFYTTIRTRLSTWRRLYLPLQSVSSDLFVYCYMTH